MTGHRVFGAHLNAVFATSVRHYRKRSLSLGIPKVINHRHHITGGLVNDNFGDLFSLKLQRIRVDLAGLKLTSARFTQIQSLRWERCLRGCQYGKKCAEHARKDQAEVEYPH